MVNYSKNIISVRGADLGDVSSVSVRKMSVFVSRPRKIVTVHRKNGKTPKLVVDFLLGREKHNPEKKKNGNVDFFKEKITTTTKLGNCRGFCV